MIEQEIATDDGLLRFLISDPLEEYRVKTLLTKEPETIKWIDSWRTLKSEEPLRFWDVGSNIGIYTLYAAAKIPNLQVVSYEPFFKNFAKLKTNIYLNKLSNVTPMWIALSKESGIATFGVQDERFGASGNVLMSMEDLDSLGERDPSKARFKSTEAMLQASGDDILRLNLQAPNFLKIDVDGLELEIIQGMPGILGSDALKSVLVEINSKPCLETITALFRVHGLVPDDAFNKLDNHSSKRRSKDVRNTAENWVFTKA